MTLTALIAVGCSEQTKDDKRKTLQNTSVKKSPQNQYYFTQRNDKKAFMQTVKGLSHEAQDKLVMGKSFFTIPWVEAPASTTARDGLGPLFSANTCIHCHPHNGAGVAVKEDGTMSRSLLLRLSHRKSDNKTLKRTVGFEPDSTYGAQLSRHSNANVKAEGKAHVVYFEMAGSYPDGTTYSLRQPSYSVTHKAYGDFDKETVLAPRIGSALVGLGALEDIAEADILRYEDVKDKDADGISGKANYVFNPESNTTQLGRFTWKASATSVKHQTAGAAHNDMGLSSPLFPFSNCTSKQKACLEAEKLGMGKGKHTLEMPEHRLDAVAFYVSHLAIPKQREPQKHQEGKKLFETLNCTSCHVPSYKTASGMNIAPYTDLLVHDMGQALADGRSEFLALGTEWRTAPLWGIGLYDKVSGEANYLHDGRARNIEEAILWHGGEAQKSKEAFMALSRQEREKVLAFLKSI